MSLTALSLFAAVADPGTEQWRANRETALKAPDGWLSVAGLFWLKEGENQIGSAAGSRILLPTRLAKRAGTLVWSGGRATFIAGPGGEATVNGKSETKVELRADRDGKPDVVRIGDCTLFLIERGGQTGIRLKDPQSKFRQEFSGLRWFPIDSQWVVKARFHAYPQPRKMLFDAQAGGKQEMVSPGYAEWEWKGEKLRLTPVQEGEELFFIFRDRTAGKETYAAARFLYAKKAADGFVTLDFNRAYNPPCVFTPYATCPLPPEENRLKIALRAGERMPDGGAH